MKIASSPQAIAAMTQAESLEWLIHHDKEGAEYWRSLRNTTTDFRAAVLVDCTDFGFEE